MTMIIDNFVWTGRHQLNDASINADQAEITALLEQTTSTSVSILDERIAELTEDGLEDIPNSLEAQISRDDRLEAMLGETLEEIERRQYWLGNEYPFVLEHGALTYVGSQTGAYEYCLAISQAPNVTTNPYTELVRYFEIFAADIFRMYIGDHSDFLRTGSPAVDHPRSALNLRDALERVFDATGELRWAPQEDAAGDEPNIKDEGLDFIVWKKLDERKGSFFIFGQCACGRNDWFEKHQDLDTGLKRVSRWTNNMSAVPPVRAFALPHPITSAKVFSTFTNYAGITMDRIRITKIAESESNRQYFIAEHKQKIEELTELVTSTYF